MSTVDAQWIGIITAVIFGTFGAALSLFTYLRDSIKVKVEVSWNMTPHNLPQYDQNKLYMVITVTNVGRRTVYVNKAHIKLPNKQGDILINESIKGQRLSEGDPPATYLVEQDELLYHSKILSSLRVTIFDSTGKMYHSKRFYGFPLWDQTK